jgi:hypothetical protein
MAKIKFTTGNFDLDIEGELSAEQREKALENGLTYIVQRDVASNVYRDLAGEGDKKTLPKGFERKSVEYSDDSAELMREAAETALAKYGRFSVSVSQHVPSEGVSEPGKMATAMWEQVKGNAALRTNLGVAANATEDEGIAACRAFLAGLRGKKE